MAKKPDLARVGVVLEQLRRPAHPAGGKARREGTVPITVHVAPEVRAQLKILAIEKQTTAHALVCAALNTLFAQNGKPEIAR